MSIDPRYKRCPECRGQMQLVMQKVFMGRSLVRGIMLFPYVAPVVAVAYACRV